jgi:hypothetical protein
MPKTFDPEGVELFKMFSVEINENGVELWHYRPVNQNGVDVTAEKRVRTKEEHEAAVEALAAFYAPYVLASANDHKAEFPSPFDKPKA